MRRLALAAGFGFLYLPLAVLIVLSFNDSRLVTQWSGASLRWYVALARDERMWEAVVVSLQVAALAASLATLLGAAVGYALARFGRFRGRAWLLAIVLAPLVLPEVITGLALLLTFVELEQLIGWPIERGVDTLAIAHATFAIGYVAVVVRARLDGTDPALEEAAADLGAAPWQVLWCVTLPLLLPALAAGWLLAFTLSLDDLVIASFVSGPGATTLPMQVFASVRLGLDPRINALGTLTVAVVAVAVLATTAVLARRER
ncbi:MAG: ABC transporter permease subunit [Alphaproteobacteria bacterium]|nr:ABC transporter permease subunit [Alphaproteobacteria bacterium]TAD90838.1 MAG: ABC transporter permease subunit [Alphaproteobacteria bacterium]